MIYIISQKRKLIQNDKRADSGCLGEGGEEEKITETRQETVGSDGYVHFSNWSDAFTGETCQNIKFCTLNVYSTCIYCMILVILQSSCLKF